MDQLPVSQNELASGYVTRSSHFPPDINQRFFGLLQVLPAEKMYENLEQDERVLFVVGRHWITRIAPITLGLVLVLVPALAWTLLLLLLPAGVLIRYGLMLTWFWYCYVFYYFIALFLVWRGDVYIVTDERIIDFDANSIARKTVSDYDLSGIDQVTYKSGGGLIRGGMDYGDVIVKSKIGVIEMKNVPMPSQLALAIGELVEVYKKSSPSAAPIAANPTNPAP